MKYMRMSFLGIIVLLLLSGCLDGSLTFQLRYDQILGLKKSDLVYFENNNVGVVEKISYTDQGDYLVDVNIQKEFKNAATRDSKFFIGYSPENNGDRAVIIVKEETGGIVLESGDIVQGSKKPDLLEMILSSVSQNTGITEDEMREALQQWKESLSDASSQIDSELERGIEDIARQLKKFGKKIESVPDSKEVKELEESIKQFGLEFSRAQEEIRDQIQREILPRLQQELDELRRRLQKEGREQEIEEMEKQVQEMTMV